MFPFSVIKGSATIFPLAFLKALQHFSLYRFKGIATLFPLENKGKSVATWHIKGNLKPMRHFLMGGGISKNYFLHLVTYY